ncbi:MAG: transporter permease [Herbinix sp.]|jgi:ABC-2 type transport system permease protein|nr:transporter permease [Herbinix sp.]
MKKYGSFFRMRFVSGLQYRAAALAGIATQFAWGTMQILLYHAFYETNQAAFPMTLEALSSYTWLQQAFLAIFMMWFFENEIFQAISDGGISYELCRPINIYNMWFTRNVANRLSRTVLRCFPIIIVAAFLPSPYGIRLPVSFHAAFWFIISMILAFLVVVSLCMFVYIATFYTLSPLGVRILAVTVMDFFSGAVIPLPFFPDNMRLVLELLPFASSLNVPLRIYTGDIIGSELYRRVGIQAIWLLILILLGRGWMIKALKRVIVQGG